MSDNTPSSILYSMRDCPFCMRARLAIASSGMQVELREVALPDKPDALLEASPKGTIPVIVTPEGRVIDESFDIMYWALEQDDPLGYLFPGTSDADMATLIKESADHFVPAMLRLKVPHKFDDVDAQDWQGQAESFLVKLEKRLEHQRYLTGTRVSLADISIVPFVVLLDEKQPHLRGKLKLDKLSHWIESFKLSDLYRRVMADYPTWHPGAEPQRFPL